MTAAEYFQQLPRGQRAALERVRTIIYNTVPDAEEHMQYGMPTYSLHGKRFLHMAAFTNHMSLFGNVDQFADQLEGYMLTGKGTVQFIEDHPIPEATIAAIIQSRIT